MSKGCWRVMSSPLFAASQEYCTFAGSASVCHTAAMRTTLDLDDELMSALLARHPGETKTRAVEHAIQDYLRRDAVRKLEALVGKIEIEDVSKELRRIDRLA